MTNVVEVRDLVRRYGDMVAVDGISFDVKRGSLFAFLGPNGAGKSTTISMLISLLKPTEGTITYYVDQDRPLDVTNDRMALKNRLGVVFQDSILDSQLSVRSNLIARAKLYSDGLRNLDKIKEVLHIEELMGNGYGTLSGGQRRRVDIARALLNQPEILFLDEPTTGLDPQSRRLVWDTMRRLQGEMGITIFLTTHYMEEADDADEVQVIDGGKIIAAGAPADLKAQHSEHLLKLPAGQGFEQAARLARMHFERRGDVLHVVIPEPRLAVAFIADYRDDIEDFEFVHGTMDDVFLSLTGRGLREN